MASKVYEIDIESKVKDFIKVGQEFKNLKELLIILGLPSECQGNKKMTLVKHLNRFLKYEKVSGTNRIVVKEIYKYPKKIDNKQEKYYKFIKIILMEYFYSQDQENVLVTKNSLIPILGMKNEDYDNSKTFLETDLKIFDISQKEISSFKYRVHKNQWNIIDHALKVMKKDSLIQISEKIVIKQEINDSIQKRFATNEEVSKISNIKNKIMLEFGVKSEHDVYLLKNKQTFNNHLNKALSDVFSDDSSGVKFIGSYNTLYITFDKKKLKKEMLSYDYNRATFYRDCLLEINKNMILSADKSAIANRKNELKYIDDYYQKYLDDNTKSSKEKVSYDTFLKNSDWVSDIDKQKILSQKLLKITDEQGNIRKSFKRYIKKLDPSIFKILKKM